MNKHNHHQHIPHNQRHENWEFEYVEGYQRFSIDGHVDRELETATLLHDLFAFKGGDFYHKDGRKAGYTDANGDYRIAFNGDVHLKADLLALYNLSPGRSEIDAAQS